MAELSVLLHHDVGPELAQEVRSRATQNVRITCCSVADRHAYLAALESTDVLFHVLDPVTEAELVAAPQLRLVQKLGVGVNTIDLEACRRRKICVCNMPGTNAPAVVEATLLLMLAALRRLPDWHARTTSGGGWPTDPQLADTMGELAGRTVGLVGYGDIAQRLDLVLQTLGASVLHHSRRSDRSGWRPLDDLLAEADVVSLHLPLTDETRAIIDQRRFDLLKPGAVLVNTARGGLVDQHALADALQTGRLRAAGLDVFAEEPVDRDDPLLSLPNVVLLPHVAWLTAETMARCLDVGMENVRRLAHGEELLHRVV